MCSKRGISITIGEEEVNFFQGEVGCFGVEEVDDLHGSFSACKQIEDPKGAKHSYRNKGKIQAHEDQISLPSKIIDQSRRDHYYEEVPEPVGGDANCLSSRC